MMYPKWTEAEKLFLIENYDLLTRAELADKLGKTFLAVKSKARDLKLTKSPEAMAELWKRPNAGQFKKGDLPKNTLSDYMITTRVDQGGRVIKYIRVALGKWVELQHYNWKQAGKDIPSGMVLVFKDGDSTNCEISNLELITKAENLSRNRPKPQDQPKVFEQIVASRKSPAAKKLHHKEKKRRALRKVSEVRKSLTRTEKQQKKILHQQTEQKKKTKQQILQAEQKRQAKAEKERKRIVAEFEDKRKLPTRQIDYSQLIPLRIDHRTVVYIKPTQDPEKVMEKYGAKAKEDFINAFGHTPPSYEF